MIEMLQIGRQYASNIVCVANALGRALTERGIYVKRISDELFTRTHQIYIGTGKYGIDDTYANFQNMVLHLISAIPHTFQASESESKKLRDTDLKNTLMN